MEMYQKMSDVQQTSDSVIENKMKYSVPKIRAVLFAIEYGFSVSGSELNVAPLIGTINSGGSFWEGNGEEGVVAGVFDSTNFSW